VFDANGNLVFADTGNNRVRAIDTAGRIRTVAGNGVRGFAGDGARATAARLAAPSSVAFLRSTFFVADTLNNRVRAFSEGGYIVTYAGSASNTTTGDGGHALSARLVLPTVTASGPNGVVYVADTGDHRVRKIDTNGVVTTVAGTGVAGFSGDGGSARFAKLNAPQGLAVDRFGNLYISDTMNQRVRRVDTHGIITTVAGTGAAGFGGDGGPARSAKLLVPTGLATDRNGNVYVADTANNRIRKISPRGIITTIAGTGAMGYAGEGRSARSAALNRPFGVAVDGDGNVFVADTYNHRVRVIGTTGIITTLAGSKARGYVGDGGPASMAQLNSPFAVAVAGGTVYIADTGNRRIRVVTPDGIIATMAGNGQTAPTPDGIPGVASTLVKPMAITLMPNGMLIPDAGDNRVRFLERTPAF
jgi:sugar lactone lactonase YvrE